MATGPKILYDAGDERWCAVFENCPIGIAVAEVDGRYVAANATFQMILRCTEDDLRQSLLTDLTDQPPRLLLCARTQCESESLNEATYLFRDRTEAGRLLAE